MKTETVRIAVERGTAYRGKCPKCGTELVARPRRRIVHWPYAQWERFSKALGTLFEGLGRL